MAKSLREVEEQMSAVGIDVPPGVDLVVNGSNWKRFKPNNSHFKRGKEAWYGIWEVTLASGRNYYFGAFGIGSQSYKIEHGRSGWTRDEWQQIQSRKEQDQQTVDQALEERRKSAAEKAMKMLSAASASVSMSHPYVAKKQILPYGAYQLRNQILLPMCKEGRVVGLQTIFPAEAQDGTTQIQKRFLSGSDLKGSYLMLGDTLQPPEAVILTEGWATGCSIFKAVGIPVAVAFSAINLLPVAESLRKDYPNTKIVIAADNDCHYHKSLKREVQERFGIELNIAASRASAREQPVPGGKILAWWSAKDKETYLEYEEWTEGRSRPSHRSLCNTGVVKAKIAASRVGGCVLIPRFANPEQGGTDFNDLEIQEGADAVKQQLAWRQAEPLSKGGKVKNPAPADMNIINTLGERYIAIDSTDTCWDAQYQRVTKIGTIRQWFGAKTVNLWLQNVFNNRRIIQPEQLIFEPDTKKVPKGSISMFSGWPMKPEYDASRCQKMIDHLFKICGNSDDLFQWVVRWLAYPLQHPGAKMHTALVIYGEREGTGKSIFFNAIMRIYGQYACSVNQNMVQSDFNGWVSKKLFVVCEEVVTNQEKRNLKGALKNLVTNPTHTINEKGLPARFEENKTNFVFLSNELQPLILDSADRRYQAINFETYSPPEYFKDLAYEIEHGGIEAFYGYLLSFDTSNFDPSERPLETPARRDLRRLGSDSATRFIEDWITGQVDLPVGPAVVSHLYDGYVVWCKSFGERPATREVFGGRCRSRLDGRRTRVEIFTSDASAAVPSTQVLLRQVYWPKLKPDQTSPIESPKFNSWLRDFQSAVSKVKERYYRDFKSMQ